MVRTAKYLIGAKRSIFSQRYQACNRVSGSSLKGRYADICFWPDSVDDLRVGDHVFDLHLVGRESDGDISIGLDAGEGHTDARVECGC